jgi:isocitrate/isopropylmalate dehydrogenase
VALLLEWLEDPETVAAAERIRQAVARLACAPTLRTPDLGGRLTTRDIGDAIVARL